MCKLWNNLLSSIEDLQTFLKETYPPFRVARDSRRPIETGLKGTPAIVILGIVGWLAWVGSKKLTTSAILVALLYLIGSFGLWDKLLQTLAIMLVSTTLAVVLGLPMGILMSRSAWPGRGRGYRYAPALGLALCRGHRRCHRCGPIATATCAAC